MSKRYLTSTEQECFDAKGFDTREEAINHMRKTLEPGTLFYVVETEPITVDAIKKCIELDAERLELNLFDYAEVIPEDGWLSADEFENDEELKELMAKHIFKKYPPKFSAIKHTEDIIA